MKPEQPYVSELTFEPTTESPILIPDFVLLRTGGFHKPLEFSSQPFYGNITQASQFCRTNPQYALPNQQDLVSLLCVASLNREKKSPLAQIKNKLLHSGHFLSGIHTFEDYTGDEHWFQIAPSPDYTGESYTTAMKFNGIKGYHIEVDEDPLDLIKYFVLGKEPTERLYSAFSEIFRNEVELRTPHTERRVNPHGIISIQGTLNHAIFSVITDPATTGIVPLLIQK